MEMNAKAKEARREYHRKWRKVHPDNVAAANMRFWTKKAAEARSAADNGADGEADE